MSSRREREVESSARRNGASRGGLSFESVSRPDERKRQCRAFYDEVNRQLDASAFGDAAFFLNYGYLSDGSQDYATVALPTRCLNMNSTKLVLEVVADTDLVGRRVLDVGCGRGGTIHTLRRFLTPGAMTGVDSASKAIRFCKSVHGHEGVTFVEGDAEKLPFASSSFDVVMNVESSHSYPTIEAFYAEVSRVLAESGAFLYADMMPREGRDGYITSLEKVGFDLERFRDITNNVLLSCDEVAALRTEAFDVANDDAAIAKFLGVPGSEFYSDLKSRDCTYEIWTLRKTSGRGDV